MFISPAISTALAKAAWISGKRPYKEGKDNE